MIILTNKLLFLNYKRIWFANTISQYKKTDFISLRQFSGEKPVGWQEKKFTTLFSDLTEDEEILLNKTGKNNKYKIKRAERDGIVVKTGSIFTFKDFFNNFAPSKNLKKLSLKNLLTYKPYTLITQAEYNDKILAMHMHLLDKNIFRARLLYSATLNRQDTDISLNLIGMGNRLLHWKDMLLLKNDGFKIYDWGGIADNPDNIATSGIDDFKKSFGGVIVHENHYESPNLSKLKKILRK